MSLTLLLCLVLTLDAGHVRRVIDGDTFTLYHVGFRGEEIVRLANTDAPERGELLHREATDSLRAFLARGPFEFRACRRDSFGRILGLVSREGIEYTWRPQ